MRGPYPGAVLADTDHEAAAGRPDEAGRPLPLHPTDDFHAQHRRVSCVALLFPDDTVFSCITLCPCYTLYVCLGR